MIYRFHSKICIRVFSSNLVVFCQLIFCILLVKLLCCFFGSLRRTLGFCYLLLLPLSRCYRGKAGRRQWPRAKGKKEFSRNCVALVGTDGRAVPHHRPPRLASSPVRKSLGPKSLSPISSRLKTLHSPTQASKETLEW